MRGKKKERRERKHGGCDLILKTSRTCRLTHTHTHNSYTYKLNHFYNTHKTGPRKGYDPWWIKEGIT
jgi:hypothetical protein